MLAYLKESGLTDKNGNAPVLHTGNKGQNYPQLIDCEGRKTMVSRSEIGCYASHYEIWQKVAESDFESVLILEDDARLKPEFSELIAKWDSLPKWDLLWFHDKAYSKMPIERNPIAGFDNLFSGYGYWLTHAYCITKETAQKLLPLMAVQRGGLDWQLSQVQKQFKTMCVSGDLIYQKKTSFLTSTILHTRI